MLFHFVFLFSSQVRCKVFEKISLEFLWKVNGQRESPVRMLQSCFAIKHSNGIANTTYPDLIDRDVPLIRAALNVNQSDVVRAFHLALKPT